MKVAFLLNHRYAPYHKWLYREFLKLPKLAQDVDPPLKEGFQKSEERSQIASQIEEIYTRHLIELGYQPADYAPRDGRTVAYPENELLKYARAVRLSIDSPEIRNLKTFSEVLLPSWKATWMWVRPSE